MERCAYTRVHCERNSLEECGEGGGVGGWYSDDLWSGHADALIRILERPAKSGGSNHTRLGDYEHRLFKVREGMR